MYPSVWLEPMSRREIVSYRFLGIQWILLSMQNSFFSKAQKGKILENVTDLLGGMFHPCEAAVAADLSFI